MQQKQTLRFLPWIVWGLAATFFLLQYIARVLPSVIAPELMHDFAVNATALGGLSSVFLWTYSGMQVPVGMFVDRFGVRRLLIIMTILAAVGNTIFAVSHSVYLAQFGRFIMGFASAFGFISAIKLATVWFPPNRLGMLTGATQALGSLGVALGEITISMIIAYLGWRYTSFAISMLFLMLSFSIFLFVKDRPPGVEKQTKQTDDAISLGQSLMMVLKNPQSWINAIYVGGMYAPVAAFGELWGVSFLKTTNHISNETAAIIVSAVFFGWAIGAPFVGWLSDHIGKRRPVMLASVLVNLLLLGIALYVPNLSSVLLFILLFLFGTTNPGVAVSYALAGELNPRRIAGTSVAFANMASVLVGTALQPIIGFLLDLNWDGVMAHGIRVYSATNYRIAMSTLMIVLAISFLTVFFIRETYCKSPE